MSVQLMDSAGGVRPPSLAWLSNSSTAPAPGGLSGLEAPPWVSAAVTDQPQTWLTHLTNAPCSPAGPVEGALLEL